MNSDPIRAVIVDDQAAMRQALSALLEAEPDVTVVGRAADGEEGLKVVFQTHPDVVLLDLEMPRLDGFAFLRLLMAKRPTPVVVVSSHATRESVFKALELGALEFVAKPVFKGAPDLSGIREDLLSKIRLSRRLEAIMLTNRAREVNLGAQRPIGAAAAPQIGMPERLVCLGASTGGPTSILTLLLELDTSLPIAVLISQHMPENFTRGFADRLRRTTPWRVREAEAGEFVNSGEVLVASGSWSLRVAREGEGLRVLSPLPGESRSEGFVPSVDRMLESAAAAMGDRVIAVILTGMAGDGVKGARAVHAAGGRVLAEAPESAVIASMPEEAIRSGAVDEVVPLHRMANAIRRLVTAR